jgi:hypothetical protein
MSCGGDVKLFLQNSYDKNQISCDGDTFRLPGKWQKFIYKINIQIKFRVCLNQPGEFQVG